MYKYVQFVIWSKILFWKETGENFVTTIKQTNLENRFHIAIENPKEGFNDTIFQHFVDKLKC